MRRALALKAAVLAALLLPACLCAGAVNAEPSILPEETPEIIRQKRHPVPPEEDREAQLLPWANKLEGCAVTYYDICEACCGKADGITYSGTPAVPYETCAVDPEIIPLGAWVAVDYGDGELHYYHAEDAGAGVKGNHIDICVASHEEARQLGVKEATVYWTASN